MPYTYMRAIVPAAGYYSDPGNPASLETEVLLGERVRVLEDAKSNSHVLVKSELYARPGFVLREHLGTFDPSTHAPTHRTIGAQVNAYQGPHYKSGVRARLPFNAQVVATGESFRLREGLLLEFAELGWIFEDQVRRLDQPMKDYVHVARSRRHQTGAYVWGGRAQPDCSAFIMDTLLACGIKCARNVKEQAAQLGIKVFDGTLDDLRKGDFVFWADPATTGSHVVLMTDPRHCIHATIASPSRGIIEEPLSTVIRKQEKDGNGRPTAVRRFPQHRF